MSQLFYIHPDNPQPRLINQAVEVLRKGGVIVYPTDSGYALGLHAGREGGDGTHFAASVNWTATTTLP
ncbi:Putative translation factor (SUA5) [Serratia marcescens]|uniref:Translation factor (SUA5) n=1 Tax=Serratia marcescens TaxID=615 RepID=A0A379ZE25_SERMA|nr:Putative translation factor (SUA5) [Serratia marcescens]